jgi:hypothetical protein
VIGEAATTTGQLNPDLLVGGCGCSGSCGDCAGQQEPAEESPTVFGPDFGQGLLVGAMPGEAAVAAGMLGFGSREGPATWFDQVSAGAFAEPQTTLNTRELHLYFAWNISDPEIPCHRDMFEVGTGQGGCNIWRAVLHLTPLVGDQPSVRVSSLEQVLSPTVAGSTVAHWFPSVRRYKGRTYLANSLQVGDGREDNYVQWRELLDGTAPTGLTRTLSEARFPELSANLERMAYTSVGEKIEGEVPYNIELSELNHLLGPVDTSRVSWQAHLAGTDLFYNRAEDAEFVITPGGPCLIYQGLPNRDTGDGERRIMMACQPADSPDSPFEPAIYQQTSHGCGHPAATGSGDWMTCSNEKIYTYSLEAPEHSRSLNAGIGGVLLDLTSNFEDSVFQFTEADGSQMSFDTIIQVYATWGGTDDIIIFSVMAAERDYISSPRTVKKSKIFLMKGSPSRSLGTPTPLLDSDNAIDISELIRDYSVQNGLIELNDSYKLDFCTTDFFEV